MNRISTIAAHATIVACLIGHAIMIIIGAFAVGSLPLAIVWIAAWTALDLAVIFHPWRKKVA